MPTQWHGNYKYTVAGSCGIDRIAAITPLASGWRPTDEPTIRVPVITGWLASGVSHGLRKFPTFVAARAYLDGPGTANGLAEAGDASWPVFG